MTEPQAPTAPRVRYIVLAEYVCKNCKKTFRGHDGRVLAQLSPQLEAQFCVAAEDAGAATGQTIFFARELMANVEFDILNHQGFKTVMRRHNELAQVLFDEKCAAYIGSGAAWWDAVQASARDRVWTALSSEAQEARATDRLEFQTYKQEPNKIEPPGDFDDKQKNNGYQVNNVTCQTKYMGSQVRTSSHEW